MALFNFHLTLLMDCTVYIRCLDYLFRLTSVHVHCNMVDKTVVHSSLVDVSIEL